MLQRKEFSMMVNVWPMGWREFREFCGGVEVDDRSG
jgi:hypothetical protein